MSSEKINELKRVISALKFQFKEEQKKREEAFLKTLQKYEQKIKELKNEKTDTKK